MEKDITPKVDSWIANGQVWPSEVAQALHNNIAASELEAISGSPDTGVQYLQALAQHYEKYHGTFEYNDPLPPQVGEPKVEP